MQDEGPAPGRADAASGSKGASSGRVVTALPGPVPERRGLSETAALHGQILARLGPSPVLEDELIRDLALPAEAVLRELVALEIEGQVLRQSGGMLSRL